MKINIKNVILILSLIGNLLIFYVAYKALEYRSHINHFLDKYTNVVNEFSGRHFFQEENKKLLKQKNKGNRVVLFGTQVMTNWKINDTTSTFKFINRGLPHQRLAGYLLRFKPDVIDLKPKSVIIEVSSYNFRSQHSVKEIQDYVSLMVELAKHHDIEPILTTVISLREDANDSLENHEDYVYYPVMDSLGFYNNWVRKYCVSNKISYIDFNDILSDKNGFLIHEYSSGLIDLNDKGYQIISEKALLILKKELPN